MHARSTHLRGLLDFCMEFGKTMLQGPGEFFPFGVAIDANGNTKTVAGHDSETPTTQSVYLMLMETFGSEARAGKVVAMAIGANVTIPANHHPGSPDGLRVHFETGDAACFVYVPYTFEISDSREAKVIVVYGDPIFVDISPRVFVKDVA